MKRMLKLLFLPALLFSVVSIGARAASIDFSTFVPSSSIGAVEGGDTSTIAFNYGGNKFVGSVYFDNQLYSTSLTGGSVTTFGAPLPESSSSVNKVVVAASLGQGGFASGDVYAGSGAEAKIYHYTNSGTSMNLFATLPGAAGVTTTSGNVYKVNSSGVATLVTSVGEDTEGMDIATSAWGSFAGDLLVGSENSGTIRLISPTGVVTPVTLKLLRCGDGQLCAAES